jgi:hypothetical protein
MRAQSRDTDLEAERVQIGLLRKATIARRAAIAFSLSETAIDLARSAVRRQSPGMSDRDVSLRFVAVHYGMELAERLRPYMQRKSM